MHSLLFVPSDSDRKLQNSILSGADLLILDLEDSVPMERKSAGRSLARQFIASHRGAGPLLYVRVNDLSTGLTEEDLAEVMEAEPAGIMLPKCNSFEDIERLSDRLNFYEAMHGLGVGTTRIIPIITETPVAVFNSASFGRVHPRVLGVTWGAEDLSAEVGAQETRDGSGAYTDLFRLARSKTLLVAAAAEAMAIDTVFPDFHDSEGFRRDCLEAVRDGFSARMAIHPRQVPTINEIFRPSADAIANARLIVEAFEKAGNPGVVAVNGKMYDRPHLKRARRILMRD